jgi:hypothetical protein
MFAVDALSAQYFTAKAAAEHKTTMESIGELVREKIAVASGQQGAPTASVPSAL